MRWNVMRALAILALMMCLTCCAGQQARPENPLRYLLLPPNPVAAEVTPHPAMANDGTTGFYLSTEDFRALADEVLHWRQWGHAVRRGLEKAQGKDVKPEPEPENPGPEDF